MEEIGRVEGELKSTTEEVKQLDVSAEVCRCICIRIYVRMCVYVYIYVYVYVELIVFLSKFTKRCMYVYVYIYQFFCTR